MDFRSFLVQLEERGELVRISAPVQLEYEPGALCRQLADLDGPAALLENVENHHLPLALNVYGTRRRLAMALGVSESELLRFVAERLRRRMPPVLRSDNAAPCQEVIRTGSDADVTALPIPLWNEGDGGPYITAGLTIARHPEFGLNIAHHRAQVYGPRELGICMAPDHHMRLATDVAHREGRRLDAAIVLGAPPVATIAASSDFPLGDYELDVAGALQDRPLELVQCRTVDIQVPADAEIIIEGYYDGEVRAEGPFVEFTGYQTPVIQSPVFHVTAITHRTHPICHGVFAGKPPCETVTLWRELEEADAFGNLQRRFPLLTGLHRPPQIARDFTGILQINPGLVRPGIVRTLMLATSAVMPRLKFIFCVDDDIDIYNLPDVLWAVSTRCNPNTDVVVVPGTMTSFLDPASGGLAGKLLVDATKKEFFRGQMPTFPEAAMARAAELLVDVLRPTILADQR